MLDSHFLKITAKSLILEFGSIVGSDFSDGVAELNLNLCEESDNHCWSLIFASKKVDPGPSGEIIDDKQYIPFSINHLYTHRTT